MKGECHRAETEGRPTIMAVKGKLRENVIVNKSVSQRAAK